MEFTEFFAIAKEFGVTYPSMVAPSREKKGFKYPTRGEEQAWREANPDLAFFEESWRIGGEQGGSCWDDGTEDHHCPITASPEPPMSDLDELLLKVAPNISFLVYRNLENKLLQRDERRESEYYGNWTEYGIKRINIKKLYDYLVEHGVL